MTSANITLIPAWSGNYDVGIFRGANNDFTLDSASTYGQLLRFRIIHEDGFAEKLLDLQGKTIACMCESIETCHGNKRIRAVEWILEHGGAEGVRQLTASQFYDVQPLKVRDHKNNLVDNEHAGQLINRPHPRVAGWVTTPKVEEIESPF